MDQSLLKGPMARSIVLLILAVSVSVLFFGMISNFILAVVLGAILAGLLHPLYLSLLGKFKGVAWLAVTATILITLLVIVVPMMVFIGVLVNEAIDLTQTVTTWVNQKLENPGELQQWLESNTLFQKLAPYQEKVIAKAGELAENIATFAVNGLAGGTQATANFFLQIVVMLYAMIHFLTSGQGLLDSVFRYIPVTREDQQRLMDTFTTVTRSTIRGSLVIGVVQGALGGIAFAVAGIDGAVFWATVMMLFSLIPGIGTAIVWVPASLYLALDGRYGAAIGMFLWGGLVISTVDNILRPMLVGKDVEMPDVLVLLGTLGGLMLFGPIGVVLGPVVAALFLTVWQLYGIAIDEATDRPQTP
jgi:predicted PurR-regulated permease PerM